MKTTPQVSRENGVKRRDFLCALAATGAGVALGSQILRAAEPAAQAAPAAPVISRKIKLGLIGCGGRGAWLGGFFKEHGGFDIVATADYDQAQADKAGDALGVDKARRFSGLSAYKKLLDSGVEAVTVVNIPRFHAEHAHAAVEAGCHVYAAKPVAIDVPRALKVLAAGKLATQKKQVYLVDYQMPSDPVNIEIVQRIRDGGLGRLMHVDSNGFSGVWPDPAERQVDHLLHHGNWLTTIALSGDFIVEYSIHALDAVLWAVGQRPISATGRTRYCRPNARGDGRDLYLVTYEFADGLVWTHRCQALNNNTDNPIKCEIFGEQANALLTYSGKSFLRGGPKQYGGPIISLYDQGAKRNIALFYQQVIDGRYDNPTVARAVDDALTGILGREAAARHTALKMTDLIAENKELELDLQGAKA